MRTNSYDNIVREIGIDCSALKLDRKIENEAIQILDRYISKEKLRGRTIERYASAIIYLACRRWNQPMTPTRMNDILDLDTKGAKGSSIIYNTSRHISQVIGRYFQPTTVDKYIDMVQAVVHSPPESYARAYFLLDYLKKHDVVVGDNSPSLAAAISYLADRIEDYRVTEEEYCRIIGITSVSLRNYKRKILQAIPNIKQHKTRYEWVEDSVPYTESVKQ